MDKQTNRTHDDGMLAESDEPAYSPKAAPAQPAEDSFRHLALMAMLPLIDGFFLSFLVAGLWRDPLQAAAFGLTAFSGAGAVVAAMRLPGTLSARLARVGLLYVLLAAGAILVLLAQPFFESLLPANLHLFTAVFLIGLALHVSGEAFFQRCASHLGWTAAVKAMVFTSVLQGLTQGVGWRFEPRWDALPSVLLAVVAGFILTMVGVFLGYVVGWSGDDNLRPLRLSAMVSLLLMGTNVLGLGVPATAVIAPLAVGIVWAVAGALWLALTQRQLRQPAQ